MSVINETMAQRYFPRSEPDRKALGRQQQLRGRRSRDRWRRRGCTLQRREGRIGQHVVSYQRYRAQRYLRSIELRTSGNPAALASAVRHALRESEPRLAIGAIETLDERIVGSIRVERLLGWLTMTFGAAALGLACLGLYGTISYAVRRRTAELGIRMALGADRSALQWLIVREALLLVVIGGAIGLPLAFVAARAVGGLLYGTASVRSSRRTGRRSACSSLCLRCGVYPGVASIAARSDGGTTERVTLPYVWNADVAPRNP